MKDGRFTIGLKPRQLHYYIKISIIFVPKYSARRRARCVLHARPISFWMQWSEHSHVSSLQRGPRVHPQGLGRVAKTKSELQAYKEAVWQEESVVCRRNVTCVAGSAFLCTQENELTSVAVGWCRLYAWLLQTDRQTKRRTSFRYAKGS
jgi:hypothetical protein